MDQILSFMRPSQNLAELLFSLQPYLFETCDPIFNDLMGPLAEQECCIAHYCTPIEKSLFLNRLFSLFLDENTAQGTRWQAIFIDIVHQYSFAEVEKKHGFALHQAIRTVKQITVCELLINLRGIRYELGQNNQIKLLVVDSVEYHKFAHKQTQQNKTIKDRLHWLEREQWNAFWEILGQIRKDFRVVVVVLCFQAHAKDILKQHDTQVVAGPRLVGTLQPNSFCNHQLFMIPISLIEQSLYKRIMEKVVKLHELGAASAVHVNKTVVVVKQRDTHLEYWAILMHDDLVMLEGGHVGIIS